MFLSMPKRNLGAMLMVLLLTVVMLLLTCCKVQSPESPEKTIPSILRSPKLPLPVMDKSMEVTMLTLRLSVKHSIFAQLMELEVLPSTASSVLMEHSSTRTISSVIGGSTLTAPLLRIFTLSMMRLLLNVKLLQPMPWENTELRPTMLLLLLLLVTILPVLMKVLEPMKKKDEEVADLETGETTDVDVEEEGEETSEVESKVRIRKPYREN